MANDIFGNIINSVANGTESINDTTPKGLFGGSIAEPVKDVLPQRNKPYQRFDEEFDNDEEFELQSNDDDALFERYNPKTKSFNGSITDEQLEIMARRNIEFMLLTNLEGLTIAHKVMAHFSLTKTEKLILQQHRNQTKIFPIDVIEELRFKEERKNEFERQVIDLDGLIDKELLIQSEIELLKKKRELGKIKAENPIHQIMKASLISLAKSTGNNFDMLPTIGKNMLKAIKGEA